MHRLSQATTRTTETEEPSSDGWGETSPLFDGQKSPLLWYFVERTSNIKLDPWQLVLCARLQKTAAQTGQRILIHAPPQAGKSIIVSQRFPAWLLAIKPVARVKLACYNITHAAKFGGVVRDVMTSASYHNFFPSWQSLVPDRTSKEAFSTAARTGVLDGQSSFKALGLQTGFVGEGAEYLLIDDPYASPQDAYSPVMRENAWTFWADSAKVRLKDDANVIVMFHRYHEDDLAGKMWAERNDDGTRVWEMLRFAAIADGDKTMPDPMGRVLGEKLSPRMTAAYIAEQQKNQLVWLGQFQGRPTPATGIFFDKTKFKRELAAPACPGARRIRYWDIAAAKPGAGDWTVGVLMWQDPETKYFWLSVDRFQKQPIERNQTIKETAKSDRAKYSNVKTYVEQAFGLSKEATDTIVRELAGFNVEADPVRKDKTTRAEDYKAQVNAGNVRIVEGPHVDAFLEIHAVFPLGNHDDDVDAASGAFNKLTATVIPGSAETGGERTIDQSRIDRNINSLGSGGNGFGGGFGGGGFRRG